MIIGNKELFAVELVLNDNHSSLLEGTFSYWINSIKLGNDDIIYLNDILMCMIWMNDDRNNRYYSKELSGNWERIFNKINNKIYNSENADSCPARFDISINIPYGIGHYTVFYLEDYYNGHLLFKKKSESDVEHFLLRKGIVDEVLACTYLELNSLYESAH